jgi:hypothetical protein
MRAIVPLLLILLLACFPATTASIYGQQATQEESEGDLSVVLNGEVFTTGQTITISGSVDDPNDQPILNIEIVDPEGGIVERASPEITADNTFTFSFEAGLPDPSLLGDKPMTVSGNYRVTVTYVASVTNIDEVDLEFEYIVTPRPEGGANVSGEGGQQQQAPPTTSGGGAATGITPQQAVPPPSLPSATFQNNVDGIRVGVPNGWVFEDLNNTDPSLQQGEQNYGASVLVELCPQNQATPQIGGTYLCPEAEEGLESVSVWRFVDLKSRPEFAGVVERNQSITTNDLMAYYFLFLEQKANYTNFRVLENIDTTINVIDPQTSANIATAPAKYIETTYLDANGIANEGDFVFLVLANDGNTGYALLPVTSLMPAAGQLPPEHQLVFDTFELIATNGTASATSAQSPSSPFSQQSQYEQQLRERQEMQQPLSPQLPQQQQAAQSDTSSSSSTEDSNTEDMEDTEDTTANDGGPLDDITQPLEDLFG